MDKRSVEVALNVLDEVTQSETGIDVLSDSLTEVLSYGRLTVEGLKQAEHNMRTNHAVIGEFVSSLPSARPRKAQEFIWKWGSGFRGNFLIFKEQIVLSGVNAEFAFDDEVEAASTLHNTVWKQEKVIDQKGWAMGGEVHGWNHGYGRVARNPLYILGYNQPSRQLLLASSPTFVPAEKIKADDYKAKFSAKPVEPKYFIAKAAKKDLPSITAKLDNPPMPLSAEAIAQLFRVKDGLLHADHTAPDQTVLDEKVALYPTNITDDVLIEYGVAIRLMSLARQFGKGRVGVLRKALLSAIEAD